MLAIANLFATSHIKEVIAISKGFERCLAQHCGPVLLGKKPAALFTTAHTPSSQPLQKDLLRRGYVLSALRHYPGKTLVILYQPALLQAALDNPQAQTVLSALGYPVSKGLFAMLRHLKTRLGENGEFPHEIGFFLGYPPEDVLGFIRHKGSRYKLCGQWKVYGDVQKAKELFTEYDACRRCLLEHVNNGGSICQLCAAPAAC